MLRTVAVPVERFVTNVAFDGRHIPASDTNNAKAIMALHVCYSV
jgi:hypothetical protein